MVDRISAEQFEAADGVTDWRAIDDTVHAHFVTKTFEKGLELVNAIGGLAEAANHHPDVTLTYPSVAITISTHEVNGLTARDIELAQKISAAASDLGVVADPSAIG